MFDLALDLYSKGKAGKEADRGENDEKQLGCAVFFVIVWLGWWVCLMDTEGFGRKQSYKRQKQSIERSGEEIYQFK